MALKHFNPTTPAQRGLVLVDKSSLWKGKPVKALTEEQEQERRPQQQGPCDLARHRGRHKQRYRHIDFKRRKWDAGHRRAAGI